MLFILAPYVASCQLPIPMAPHVYMHGSIGRGQRTKHKIIIFCSVLLIQATRQIWWPTSITRNRLKQSVRYVTHQLCVGYNYVPTNEIDGGEQSKLMPRCTTPDITQNDSVDTSTYISNHVQHSIVCWVNAVAHKIINIHMYSMVGLGFGVWFLLGDGSSKLPPCQTGAPYYEGGKR